MNRWVLIERFCLAGHVVAMAFGLAGLLLVLPHPEFIATLPPIGQRLFGWSMEGVEPSISCWQRSRFLSMPTALWG